MKNKRLENILKIFTLIFIISILIGLYFMAISLNSKHHEILDKYNCKETTLYYLTRNGSFRPVMDCDEIPSK